MFWEGVGLENQSFLKRYGGTVQQEQRGKQIVIYQPIREEKKNASDS